LLKFELVCLKVNKVLLRLEIAKTCSTVRLRCVYYSCNILAQRRAVPCCIKKTCLVLLAFMCLVGFVGLLLVNSG